MKTKDQEHDAEIAELFTQQNKANRAIQDHDEKNNKLAFSTRKYRHQNHES